LYFEIKKLLKIIYEYNPEFKFRIKEDRDMVIKCRELACQDGLEKYESTLNWQV
jgi:hypothetical protein